MKNLRLIFFNNNNSGKCVNIDLFFFFFFLLGETLKRPTLQKRSSSFLSAGDFKAHPKDLIIAPCWLKGFKGNELERLIRKKKMVGDRMMTLDRHNLEKRIRYLYRRFNRYGKHR